MFAGVGRCWPQGRENGWVQILFGERALTLAERRPWGRVLVGRVTAWSLRPFLRLWGNSWPTASGARRPPSRPQSSPSIDLSGLGLSGSSMPWLSLQVPNVLMLLLTRTRSARWGSWMLPGTASKQIYLLIDYYHCQVSSYLPTLHLTNRLAHGWYWEWTA